ncbi:MAG TPA: C4-type zinc ribbon domain-containing protein [Terriglobales bacterium]|nr:C4-type zinc ribbon domain-containing protein [Terriglobales bacterium]
MQNDLEMLLKLQSIDYDLEELDRSRDYLPDMIKNLKKEIEEVSGTLKDSEGRLTQQSLQKKKLELDIEEINTELAKLQKQMRDIKTNREYDALVTEIANRKKKVSDNEEELLKTLAEIDELQDKIKEYKEKLVEVEKNNRVQLESLTKEMDSIGIKIKQKQDERKNVSVRINKQMLTTYERVKKVKGGAAVVPVKKRACSGCYKSLPPQKIQEIKKGENLITCDSCGRILIWTDEE